MNRDRNLASQTAAIFSLVAASGLALGILFAGGRPQAAEAQASAMDFCSVVQSMPHQPGAGVTREAFLAARARLFDRIDRGHKGYLTQDDLDQVLPPSQAFAASRIFSTMDRNGDGKISREEFATAPAPGFDRADVNHDSVLTPDEIRPACS